MNKNIAVFGAGLVGHEIVRDLDKKIEKYHITCFLTRTQANSLSLKASTMSKFRHVDLVIERILLNY